jgi:hypothetical protein
VLWLRNELAVLQERCAAIEAQFAAVAATATSLEVTQVAMAAQLGEITGAIATLSTPPQPLEAPPPETPILPGAEDGPKESPAAQDHPPADRHVKTRRRYL